MRCALILFVSTRACVLYVCVCVCVRVRAVQDAYAKFLETVH